ncbi:TIGR01440 family protein [Cytobacillus horneckiae]|uniref:TIGR01440 family protein n=1 Tax=Cytobacillus horneckiae TaxID=549687 RepID=UPI003D9A7E2A
MEQVKQWAEQLDQIITEFSKEVQLNQQKIFLIGCSTSEVAGRRIGTAGTEQVAEMIFARLKQLNEQTGVKLAFQCCEHLNRALVIERSVANAHGLDEVSVVPIRKAGGAMAAYAFRQLQDPVVVEHLKADAGIDIGDTFIGMHLKHVVVPIRTSLKSIGAAHVTLATTRPKLIGGNRAIYE